MLTAQEKETIITLNEADKTADIEVFNARLMREIRKAVEAYPDEVTIKEGSDGSFRVTLPRKWIKIRAPRVLTDEQRAAMIERGKEQAKITGFGKKS